MKQILVLLCLCLGTRASASCAALLDFDEYPFGESKRAHSGAGAAAPKPPEVVQHLFQGVFPADVLGQVQAFQFDPDQVLAIARVVSDQYDVVDILSYGPHAGAIFLQAIAVPGVTYKEAKEVSRYGYYGERYAEARLAGADHREAFSKSIPSLQ